MGLQNSISNFFWKKKKSALWYQSKYKSKFNFDLKKKKKKKKGFSCCSTCEDLSIDASITNLGLILTKPRWFQLFGTSQNKVKIQFRSFLKFFFWGFSCCSTCKDLSIDASITNLGLILTKPRFIFISGYGHSGYGQTNKQTQFWVWKHVSTQKISTQSSKLVVSCRSLYASPGDGDAQQETSNLPMSAMVLQVLGVETE